MPARDLGETPDRRRDPIFRSIFDSAAVGVVLVGADGRVLRTNRALEEALGYEPRALEGMPLAELMHPEDVAATVGRIEQIRNGAVRDYREERRYLRSDGTVIWARVSVASLVDTPGTAAVAVGIIEDVTARRRAEEDLAEQNEDLARLASVLRAVLDSTIDGIMLTDLEGNIQLANRPMVQLVRDLGITADGTAVDRLLSVAERIVDRERFVQTMERLRATPEEPSLDEFQLRESQRAFQGFTAPVRGEGGAMLGRIWTLREVTQERELDRLKDDFVATVSHELRTPLTSMMGFLEMLREGEAGELNAEQERFLSIVYRSSERLQRLVGDLLFVARLDASGLQLQLGDVRLHEVVADAVEAVAALARARDIDLELDAAPVAPVTADRERLAQLVANLLSNALKFTPAGGRVFARTFEHDGSVVVEVEDTGIGIPRVEQERLFERFFRSSTATEQAIPGTGLGLAITKAIVEAHGGTVSVASTPGEGTCFHVELPLA
jgi:PAS domain S-box-containing protein